MLLPSQWVYYVWAATALLIGLYLYAPGRAFLEARLDDIPPLSVAALGAALVFWFSLDFTVASFALLAALVLLLGAARARGALGPFDPSLLLKGGWGRRLILLGALFATSSLSTGWGMDCTHPDLIGTVQSPKTGHTAGLGALPLLLLGGCVLIAAWRGLGQNVWRLVPLLVILGLGIWAMYDLFSNNAETMAQSSYATCVPQGGQNGFMVGLLLLLPGALLFWRRPDPAIVETAAASTKEAQA